MFGLHSDAGYKEVLDGIEIKTVNFGKKMLMTEFRLTKGAVLPEHEHPHEQSGYLVSGRIRLVINNSAKTLNPGDSWSIGGGVPHHADILENSVAIEVFSPVREDYLQYANKSDIVS